MSCIVGYKDESGQVWLAGESKITCTPDSRTVTDELAHKIATFTISKSPVALAFAGDTFQSGIAVEVLAKLAGKPYKTAKALVKALAEGILLEVKRLTDLGYQLDRREGEEFLDLDMLLAYRGKLYNINGGMNHTEIARFSSIGVGQQVVEAAIIVAEKLLLSPPDPKLILPVVLETVCLMYPGFTGPPVYIEGPF